MTLEKEKSKLIQKKDDEWLKVTYVGLFSRQLFSPGSEDDFRPLFRKIGGKREMEKCGLQDIPPTLVARHLSENIHLIRDSTPFRLEPYVPFCLENLWGFLGHKLGSHT